MTTLVVIDIQKEYTTVGRLYYLNSIEPSLENCRKLLAFAREQSWHIIHIQHSNGNTAPKFNPTESFFEFVDGFEPLPDEDHYIKDDFSCYSNEAFAKQMDVIASRNGGEKIYIMGYNSVMCCLSTLEEARRRKHKMVFIADASLAKDIGAGNEHEMHETMIKLYQAKGLTEIKMTTEII